MNYFELFEIPVQLRVDKTLLPKKFFELSRKYHPDYFVNDGAEAQAMSLERSALLNRAFKTFQNPDETIKYVLQLKGLLEEEEKYELPPDFLMEVLEINEQLMEVEDHLKSEVGNLPAGQAGRKSEVVHSIELVINNLETEIYEPVKEIVEHYQEGISSEKELLQVKEYYYKKKYLHRIRKQLDGKT